MMIRQHVAVTAVFYCDLGIRAVAGLLDPTAWSYTKMGATLANQNSFGHGDLFWEGRVARDFQFML